MIEDLIVKAEKPPLLLYLFLFQIYHACDASNLYQYCMMRYEVLSFSDFLGSYMAVWVTLMVMTRLPDRLRTIFVVMGALFLALAVDYDKHGLLLNIIPLVLGAMMVFLSWVCIDFWYSSN